MGFSLELVERNWAIAVVAQIAFRPNQDYWCVGADLADLFLPSYKVMEGRASINGETEHETISSIVTDFTVDTILWVTTSVLDL